MEKYFDPAQPGSYSSFEKFYKTVKGKRTRKALRDFLLKEDAYTLHRYKRTHFKRNQIIVGGLDQQWDADVAFMNDFSSDNDGYKYFVVFIDCFSRYLYTKPLKTKEGKEMIEVMKTVFTNNRKPLKLRTDSGGEFVSQKMNIFLKKENIDHIITSNETKAALAERVIKTIKKRLYRFFTHNNTHRWIDILSDVTKSYNNTHHRTIKMAPSDVNVDNAAALWLRLYQKPQPLRLPKFKFKEGDHVRIAYLEEKFHRDFDHHFTGEVFTIVEKKLRAQIPVYKLRDFSGELIKGLFYEQEIQKIIFDPEVTFKIEKLVKTRKRKGKTEHLVKWLGWPSKYNSWVTDKDVQNI